MKRVVVTGATGFIGRHALAPLIARGYDVHAVSSRTAPPATPQVEWHVADLLDEAAVAGLLHAVRPTHLLHFAWHTNPGTFWNAPENPRWLEAGIALLHDFQRNGGLRVVMAGSCAEYEWGGDEPFTEGVSALHPATPYGVCKHSLQEALAAFSRQQGLSSAWGRIFFLYGPGEHPSRLVASLVGAMLRGEAASCSDGLQVRDFLHVEDVASAFAALLDSDVRGSVNIASGRAVAVKDVVLAAADCLGTRDLVRFGAIPRQAGEPAFLVADTRRLASEVGFVPRFDLRTGMAQTVAEAKRGAGW